MQLTEQIPKDPLRMGVKSTTTSNHPSTVLKPIQADNETTERMVSDTCRYRFERFDMSF